MDCQKAVDNVTKAAGDVLDLLATIQSLDASDEAVVKETLALAIEGGESAMNHIEACKLLKVRMQKYLDSC